MKTFPSTYLHLNSYFKFYFIFNIYYRTALHVASSKGSVIAIEFLIHHGANPNSTDSFGSTPLFEAVASRNDAAANIIFNAGGCLGLKTSETIKTSLQPATFKKDAGALICQVVSDADVQYLERLLHYGMSSQTSDYDGRTGLHIAATFGHVRIIECLLKFGANPSAVDRFGRVS